VQTQNDPNNLNHRRDREIATVDVSDASAVRGGLEECSELANSDDQELEKQEDSEAMAYLGEVIPQTDVLVDEKRDL
jgi:hypothetical protein